MTLFLGSIMLISGSSLSIVSISGQYTVEASGAALYEVRKRGDKAFSRLQWSSIPPSDLIADHYPDTLPKEIQASFSCKLGSDYTLTSCRIEDVQPASAAARILVDYATSHFRVARQSIDQAAPLTELTVGVRLRNRRGADAPTPCLPHFCAMEYVKPPPPPK